MGWEARLLQQRIRLGLPKVVIGVYLALFSLSGVVALAYSTRISLSGRRFSELYGDATLRPTYRLAFGSRDAVKSGKVYPKALHLLCRYEPRGSQKR